MVLQVGFHQGGAEGENHLPQHSSHAAFYATQDMMGFLVCKRASVDQSTGIPEKTHGGGGICIQEWDFSMNKVLYVEIGVGTTEKGPVLR